LSIGAYVIRPGLVYGDNPGGMLAAWLARCGVRALFRSFGVAGRCSTFFTKRTWGPGPGLRGWPLGAWAEPITVAHERGLELEEILTQIARALGKRVTFVPVPWQLAWLGSRAWNSRRAAEFSQR